MSSLAVNSVYVFVDMFHVCGSLILCVSDMCVTHMLSCTMNGLDESICVVCFVDNCCSVTRFGIFALLYC